MNNLTIPQFNLLCEQYLAEDFDKIVAMVKEIKPKIDQIRTKFPQIDQKGFEFMLINTLSDFDQDESRMSIEESDYFYNFLEQLYGVRNLATKVQMRQDEVRDKEGEFKAAMAGPKTPEGAIRDLAGAMGMTVHEPEPGIARPGPESFAPKHPGVSSGILDLSVEQHLDPSVRLLRVLERLGHFTIGDVINTTKSDLLDTPYFGRVTMKELTKKLDTLLNRHPNPTEYEKHLIQKWIDSPMSVPPISKKGQMSSPPRTPPGGPTHGWPGPKP